MSIQLGDKVPDFSAETTEGMVTFHSWLGDSWGILFSHPADFTPVCTTELGAASKLKGEFEKRNCKMIAISVDSVEDHKRWISDINETQGCTVNFPIIADMTQEVAKLYGMIHPNAASTGSTMTVRSVFIVKPDKTLALSITYPASTGRNFDEILRVIDSLQLTAQFKVATPANWKRGGECIIVPAVKNNEIPELFPKGHREVKPYLRYTPQPN